MYEQYNSKTNKVLRKDSSSALKEAEKMIEEKNNEITSLKEDLSQAKTYIEQQKVINSKLYWYIDFINIYSELL